MSISDNYVPLRQIGNGVTVAFSGNWNMIASSYARVYLEDATTGVQTLVTEGPGAAQYTISFNASGFTVTFNTAPTSAYYVVIGREVEQDQTDPYRTSKGFQGDVLEASLDKLTAMVQDLSDIVGRTLKFPLGSTLSGTLPGTPIDQAVLIWSGATGEVANGPDVTDIADAAAAAATAVAAAASAAATAASFNFRYCGTATGTANALVLTPGTALLSYSGAMVTFVFSAANTTEAMTVDISGLGLQNIKINASGTKTNPAIGMFQAGMVGFGQYDGTDLVVGNQPADAQGTDIAAAATVAVASQTGNFANLTGTGGPVTAMTGLRKGERYLFRHTGVQTLTHSSTFFLLNAAANITTASGDFSEYVSDGTNVYMTRYMRADGTALAGSSGSAGFKNLIINGNMMIWQRGNTSFLGTSFNYSADRWMVFRNAFAAGMTVSRSTDVPAGFTYSLNMRRDNGNSSTQQMFAVSAFETINSVPYQGQQVTLSFYMKTGANFSGTVGVTVYTGTGADQAANNFSSWTGSATPINTASISPTSSWVRYTYTGTVAAGATQINVAFARTPSGTAGAADTLLITGVQLEVGSVATSFENRGFLTELQLCQRYYAKTFAYGTTPAQNAGKVGCAIVTGPGGGSSGVFLWQFPVKMRTLPTIVTFNPSVANANWRDFTGGADVAVSVDPQTAKSEDRVSLLGAFSGGNVCGIHATADAEL